MVFLGEKVKAAVISIYMSNIFPEMKELQAKVIGKFNKNPDIHHYQVLTDTDHGSSMDIVMKSVNGYDVVMFLDIDAIPLSEGAFDFYVNHAADGHIIGNAQRSNHIDNGEHIYCGSPTVAISVETYKKIGSPSARPTKRGDVAEEWTWAAQDHGMIPLIVKPNRFDAPPIRMHWETDTRPYWPLSGNLPNYGIGTTYQNQGKDLIWHCFQSFHPGQLERFVKKCKEVLDNG